MCTYKNKIERILFLEEIYIWSWLFTVYTLSEGKISNVTLFLVRRIKYVLCWQVLPNAKIIL